MNISKPTLTNGQVVHAFKAHVLRADKLPVQSRPATAEAVMTSFFVEHADKETFDMNAAVEFWWSLARTGAVALVGDGYQSSHFQRWVLTPFGRACLERDEVSLHDRGGYLRALRSQPNADPVALSYADEAVGAWQNDLFRASAVMLGVACERLVTIIAEAVVDADVQPYADKLDKMLRPGNDKPPMAVSRVFEQVRGAVDTLNGDKETFTRSVQSIFDHARVLRNDSGHASGREVTREEAQAGLLLFPNFHGQALRVIEQFRRSQTTP